MNEGSFVSLQLCNRHTTLNQKFSLTYPIMRIWHNRVTGYIPLVLCRWCHCAHTRVHHEMEKMFEVVFKKLRIHLTVQFFYMIQYGHMVILRQIMRGHLWIRRGQLCYVGLDLQACLGWLSYTTSIKWSLVWLTYAHVLARCMIIFFYFLIGAIQL